jgi:hypothetical protein
MTTRDDIRELQAYVEALANTKAERIAIISKVQAMIAKYDPLTFKLLSIVKRRIIKGNGE